jgi:hypothetical protein
MNKAQQIREYKQANPTHKPSDIAKACGVKTTYVYQVLHADKQKKPKKEKPVTKQPTDGQNVLRNEIKRLNAAIEKWREHSAYHESRANSLYASLQKSKQHHTGLEYVISYLESRLGIEDKDDGSAV